MDIEAADANCYDPTDTKLLTFHDHVPRFVDGSDTPRAYLERCLETIDEREPRCTRVRPPQCRGGPHGCGRVDKTLP